MYNIIDERCEECTITQVCAKAERREYDRKRSIYFYRKDEEIR